MQYWPIALNSVPVDLQIYNDVVALVFWVATDQPNNILLELSLSVMYQADNSFCRLLSVCVCVCVCVCVRACVRACEHVHELLKKNSPNLLSFHYNIPKMS